MFASAVSPLVNGVWIKRLALAAVAAVAIGAAALPSKPAEAQVVIGVGVPYYGSGYYRP
jgi:ABC-type sugar transport system substrate-binding protein